MTADVKKLNKQFVKAALKNNTGAMERLLSEGAELEGVAKLWGWPAMTALAIAAADSSPAAIAFLLDRGADINQQDADGNTPLMLAIKSRYSGGVTLLLERGARTDILNKDGKSALDLSIAEEKTDVTKRLREAIAEEERKKRLAAEREQRAQEAARMPPPVERPAIAAPQPPKPPEPKKKDPDIVIFRQQAGDRVLEDIFNFASLERITFVRQGPGAPVEAMTRQSFAEVASRALLKKAFDEHVKRGGQVKEEDVFPDTKTKITSKLPGVDP